MHFVKPYLKKTVPLAAIVDVLVVVSIYFLYRINVCVANIASNYNCVSY